MHRGGGAAALIDHLIADVLSNWRKRRDTEGIPNFVLRPDDRDTARSVGDADADDAVVLTGSAVALAQWATGRGRAGVTVSGEAETRVAPRWL